MILICLISVVAWAQAATVVPLQSSNVDVRHSGSEFSYNIQETRGVAAIPDAVPIIQPLLKSVALEDKPLPVVGVEHHVKTTQTQHEAHSASKVESRSTGPIMEQPKQIDGAKLQPLNSASEAKKVEYLAPIAPPLIGTPLETIYYKTYNAGVQGVPINVFPNGPLISTIPALPAVYPYTLVRTV
ncbi:uncharacterized protein LOC109546769 [Dendroctonus ponderosae]|uniref:DUF4794 domain-containing protein n=1 Tax=Dendroctonus ponderosae TaxID=77166 RepID=U4UFI3_DENPD|nr:uncharacterized protein LOC109546769 [Dendroctonus ponderosae]ERL91787.1 hypothetical protein D910_09112 [Dendroctonus ponderosae]KAH1024281.1 hypothetical protein HUJ05_003785 [Dendroctonus ponderosae]KAH1024282.1 hypothetical protein HUJ05_003785 [Dendroctonus ponderosae]